MHARFRERLADPAPLDQAVTVRVGNALGAWETSGRCYGSSGTSIATFLSGQVSLQEAQG